MVAKTYIQKSLKDLERLYNKASSRRNEFFYSKLAILELCGWIEESMDDIVIRCTNRNIRDQSNQKKSRAIIDRTYGFHYDTHFRNILTHIIGLKGVEVVEKKLNIQKFLRFKSTLGTLKKPRDKQAHTHFKGIATTIDAPSATLAKFNSLYEGLKEIDEKLKMLNY